MSCLNKKITLNINGWVYNISVEEDFAVFLKSKISKDFTIKTPDSRKAIMHAYIKANYELFKQEQEIENIVKILSGSSPQ